MAPEPEIVVHAPLPPPTDEGVTYDAEGDTSQAGPNRPLQPLDPDPFHVMLHAPEELLDDSARSRLVAAINDAGATSIHVELAEPGHVSSELIVGLRRLGSESGAARIDVHVSGD
jgi:hypothetical protein